MVFVLSPRSLRGPGFHYILALFSFASVAFAQNIETAEYPAYKAELERYQSAFNGGVPDRGQAIAAAGLEQARAAGDRSGEAHWTRLVGASYEIRGDWTEARTWYEKSLAMRRELKQSSEMLLLTRGLGFVCYTIGDYAAARRYLEQAKELATQSRNPLDLARVWLFLGVVERGERHFTPAETAFAEATKIYGTAGAAGQGGVGLTRLEIARLDIARSQLPDALREGFEAVRLLSALPRGEAHTAQALDVVGTVFHSLEDHVKALDYFRRALELRTKIRADLTESYRFIAVELDQLGRHEEALMYLELVLKNRRAGAVGSQLAEALINVAVAQQNMGRRDVARERFAEAFKVLPADRTRTRYRAIALYGLGNLDITEGKLEDALTHHSGALQLRRDIGDSIGVVRSLNRIGIALEKAGRWNDALERHREAATAFEVLLAGIRNPVQAVSFRETSRILYRHYTRVLVHLGRPQEALAIAERGRGTGLDRIASLGHPGPQILQAAHRAANARNQFRIAFDTGSDDQNEELAYLNAVHELSRVLDMPESTPAVKQTRGPHTYDEFLALARRQPDTLFLEWVHVDEVTLLFTLSARHGLKTYTLPASGTQIQDLVDQWYSTLQSAGLTRGVKLPDGSAESSVSVREPQQAALVWKTIFGEAATDFNGFTRLSFVPDTALLKIPFSALLNDQGKRLIERFSISTAVSLASLMNVSRTVTSGSGRVYAVGDPTENGQSVSLVPQRARLGALAGARSEVRTIAELLPGSSVTVGQSARESVVKQQMGSFDVLHFATHGVLDTTDPLRSALLLAPESADSEEDGLLEGWEIASLRLKARLAVLSACDTGQGSSTLSDGVLGLSWAFQAAGCPNVLATLWSVDDAATQSIIVTFYKALRRGERIDDALRSAVQTVRTDTKIPPYYWAAFQIVGPAGPVFNSQIHASKGSRQKEEFR